MLPSWYHSANILYKTFAYAVDQARSQQEIGELDSGLIFRSNTFASSIKHLPSTMHVIHWYHLLLAVSTCQRLMGLLSAFAFKAKVTSRPWRIIECTSGMTQLFEKLLQQEKKYQIPGRTWTYKVCRQPLQKTEGTGRGASLQRKVSKKERMVSSKHDFSIGRIVWSSYFFTSWSHL